MSWSPADPLLIGTYPLGCPLRSRNRLVHRDMLDPSGTWLCDTADMAVTTHLADLISEQYLFAEQAPQLARTVESWAIPTPTTDSASDVAAELTDRLRSETGDLHFKIMQRVFAAEELAAPAKDRWKFSMPGPSQNFGFRSVQVDNGTALLALSSMDHIKWSGNTAKAAMRFAQHAERVLIDVRTCQGGDPELIELIAGYFIGPTPVELSTVHWRDGTVESCLTNSAGAEFRFGSDVPLVLIIGPQTASAGEALADHLQAAGGATVVGQNSIGAAHRVTEHQLTADLVARIPSGLVVNSFTGTDWEGTGVVPDVFCEPDSDPVETAITAART